MTATPCYTVTYEMTGMVQLSEGTHLTITAEMSRQPYDARQTVVIDSTAPDAITDLAITPTPASPATSSPSWRLTSS